MKNLIMIIACMLGIIVSCKKQKFKEILSPQKPTVLIVSTDARLLDTVWSEPSRYVHFFITFDVITGASDVYFSQLSSNYESYVTVMGPDTVYSYTLYQPLILTMLPEVIPEGGVYKISANDTARITYFGMLIAHGRWTQFSMQAYAFPYSLGENDGVYESVISLDSVSTGFP